MDCTDKNKQLVVARLREFRKGRNMSGLIENASKDSDFPEDFPDISTLYRLLVGKTSSRKMTDDTFHKLCWFLKKYSGWDGQENNVSLYESSIDLSLALNRFINPRYSSNKHHKHISAKLVGFYQGYCWSVSEPRTLVLFRVEIKYDSDNDVLLTNEIEYDPKIETYNIGDGTMAINPDNQGIHYIISRKKIDSVVVGLQLTMIHSMQNYIYGKVSEMSGIVFGQADNGPFFRNVLFHRHDSPEISCIRPDREKHAPIMNALNKMQIDLPNHLGWFAEIKVK